MELPPELELCADDDRVRFLLGEEFVVGAPPTSSMLLFLLGPASGISTEGLAVVGSLLPEPKRVCLPLVGEPACDASSLLPMLLILEDSIGGVPAGK